MSQSRETLYAIDIKSVNSSPEFTPTASDIRFDPWKMSRDERFLELIVKVLHADFTSHDVT